MQNVELESPNIQYLQGSESRRESLRRWRSLLTSLPWRCCSRSGKPVCLLFESLDGSGKLLCDQNPPPYTCPFDTVLEVGWLCRVVFASGQADMIYADHGLTGSSGMFAMRGSKSCRCLQIFAQHLHVSAVLIS